MVEERAIERFIECGDPHHGFGRIYCDACGHDYLLEFSCKTRYFCPSCHQKRVLLYGEWVEETVLAAVAHRQYVLTLPRLVRHFFARRREWLGDLCRIAERLLSRAYTEVLPAGRPALIVFVQTFGDLVNFNPHLHVLAADGAFLPGGRFIALPRVPASLLAESLRRAALDFLVKNEALSKDLRARMLAWRHGGFSAHNEDRGSGSYPAHPRSPRIVGAARHRAKPADRCRELAPACQLAPDLSPGSGHCLTCSKKRRHFAGQPRRGEGFASA